VPNTSIFVYELVVHMTRELLNCDSSDCLTYDSLVIRNSARLLEMLNPYFDGALIGAVND
jgi:hypothetical protein